MLGVFAEKQLSTLGWWMRPKWCSLLALKFLSSWDLELNILSGKWEGKENMAGWNFKEIFHFMMFCMEASFKTATQSNIMAPIFLGTKSLGSVYFQEMGEASENGLDGVRWNQAKEWRSKPEMSCALGSSTCRYNLPSSILNHYQEWIMFCIIYSFCRLKSWFIFLPLPQGSCVLSFYLGFVFLHPLLLFSSFVLHAILFFSRFSLAAQLRQRTHHNILSAKARLFLLTLFLLCKCALNEYRKFRKEVGSCLNASSESQWASVCWQQQQQQKRSHYCVH